MQPKEHLLVDTYFNLSLKSPSLCWHFWVIHRHCFYFWLVLVLNWWLLCGSSAYFSLFYCSSEEQGAWSVSALLFLWVHVVLMFVSSLLLSGYLDLVWHSQKQRAAAGEIQHSTDTERGTDLKISLTGLVRKIQLTEVKLWTKMKPINVKEVDFVLKLALLALCSVCR